MCSKTIPTLILSILWFTVVSAFGTLGISLADQEGEAGLLTASLQGEGDTGF